MLCFFGPAFYVLAERGKRDANECFIRSVTERAYKIILKAQLTRLIFTLFSLLRIYHLLTRSFCGSSVFFSFGKLCDANLCPNIFDSPGLFRTTASIFYLRAYSELPFYVLLVQEETVLALSSSIIVCVVFIFA